MTSSGITLSSFRYGWHRRRRLARLPRSEVHHGGPGAPLFERSELKSRHQRVFLQQSRDAAAEASGALAMNDPDPREPPQEGIFKVTPHALGSLLDCAADDVDLCRETIAGPGRPGDRGLAPGKRRARRGESPNGHARFPHRQLNLDHALRVRIREDRPHLPQMPDAHLLARLDPLGRAIHLLCRQRRRQPGQGRIWKLGQFPDGRSGLLDGPAAPQDPQRGLRPGGGPLRPLCRPIDPPVIAGSPLWCEGPVPTPRPLPWHARPQLAPGPLSRHPRRAGIRGHATGQAGRRLPAAVSPTNSRARWTIEEGMPRRLATSMAKLRPGNPICNLYSGCILSRSNSTAPFCIRGSWATKALIPSRCVVATT